MSEAVELNNNPEILAFDLLLEAAQSDKGANYIWSALPIEHKKSLIVLFSNPRFGARIDSSKDVYIETFPREMLSLMSLLGLPTDGLSYGVRMFLVALESVSVKAKNAAARAPDHVVCTLDLVAQIFFRIQEIHKDYFSLMDVELMRLERDFFKSTGFEKKIEYLESIKALTKRKDNDLREFYAVNNIIETKRDEIFAILARNIAMDA